MTATFLASTPEPTIHDVEQTVQLGLEALRGAPLNKQISDALAFLVPSGYRPIAQFEEDGRKKRSTAAASNWNPETGEIVIYFEKEGGQPSRLKAESGATNAPVPSLSPEARSSSGDIQAQNKIDSLEVSNALIEECCQALANAEKAGKAFISLTWFRDTALRALPYSWIDSPISRQTVLAKAIELGAIVTGSIPNPKAPLHPTTTIRLNPESMYAKKLTPRFQPVTPRGGMTASEIIIQDRGRF